MKLSKDGDDQLWIRDEVEDHTDYRPEGLHDMGWLGYFVGRHEHLTLNNRGYPISFFFGVAHHKLNFIVSAAIIYQPAY